MTTGLLSLGLVVTLASGLSLSLMRIRAAVGEAHLAAVRSDLNRDLERRLDLAVNGTSTACVAVRIPLAHPCPSPQPWRETP